MDDNQRLELFQELEEKRATERKRLQNAYVYDNSRLEKFIANKQYRNELLETSRVSQLCVEFYEFRELTKFEKMVKEKLKVPPNANIRYDKVKCSKDCKHDHKYFYAYFWDSVERKLKKKYIGKKLPETI